MNKIGVQRLPIFFLLCCLLIGVFTADRSLIDAAGAVGYDSSEASEDENLEKAKSLIGLGSYASAIPLLKKAIAGNPRDANALNLMGFSQRKLGRFELALDYYLRALDLEPQHLGANEYLGELYLQMQDLPKAEERLRVLEEACSRDCEEYRLLERAIADYRARKGS